MDGQTHPTVHPKSVFSMVDEMPVAFERVLNKDGILKMPAYFENGERCDG